MNKSKKIIILAVILAVIWHAAAGAAQVNPFFARVVVQDRSAESLADGQRRALSEVLIKLTGRPQMVRGAATPEVLDRAAGMVQTYRFANRPDRLLLEAHFDPTAVQQLADELALPVWPLERGEALAWIAVDDGDGRKLLGSGIEHQQLLGLIRDGAQANAVPIILPNIDDSTPVEASTVWGGFVDQLSSASDPYNAPYVLAARLYIDGNGWRSNWTLDDGSGQQMRWSASGSDAEQALHRGFADMASRLAQRYAAAAPSNEAGGSFLVRIYGVDSAERYGRVMSYLNRLSVVRRADPVDVATEYLDLEVESSSGPAGLARLFRLEGILGPYSDMNTTGIEASFEVLR